jgi:hypothetical protein
LTEASASSCLPFFDGRLVGRLHLIEIQMFRHAQPPQSDAATIRLENVAGV